MNPAPRRLLRSLPAPTVLVWLAVLCATVLLTLQPVATVIDSTDSLRTLVHQSTAVEAADSSDRLYRWGFPGAELVVPVLPAGPMLLTAVLTAPAEPSRLTIRMSAQPVASFVVQPAQFRTYQILVQAPATPWVTTTTIAFDTDRVYDDGTRRLTVGYGVLRTAPLAARTDVFSLAVVLQVLLICTWWGLTALLRSAVRVHAVVAGFVLACSALLCRVAGDGLTWRAVALIIPMLAALLVVTARRCVSRPTPQVQPVAQALTQHIYRPDVDGIRAIAVGVVVVFHAFPSVLPGGFIGVDIFFVISGFLISQLLLERMQRGTYSLLDFYARRVRRIFPALLLVLLTVAAAGVWLFGREQAQSIGQHVAGGAGFVANLQAAAEAGYFDDAAVRKPLLHLWSLGIEEQFYLVWPFVILAVVRWPRWGWWLLGGVVLASFVANVLTIDHPAGIAFYWPFMRVWQFSAGAALAYLPYASDERRVVRLWQRVTKKPWVSGAAVLAIGACSVGFSKAVAYPGWAALVPTVATAVLLAAPATGWVQRHLLARPLLVGIGLISYPLYLWHWPLLAYGFLLRDAHFDTPLRLLAVLASIGCAAVTYWLIEQPIRAGSLRVLHPMVLVVAVAVVGAISWWSVGAGQFQTAGAATERGDVPFVVNGSDCGPGGFKEFPARYCSFHTGTDPQAAPVFVVGDSHALYLARGFFSRHDAGTTYLRGVYGCVPLLGVETYVNAMQTSAGCATGVDALFASLDGSDTRQPRTIIYAARFTALNATKLNRTDGHTIHIQTPGPRRDITTAARLAVFRAGVEATVARLAAYPNTRVIVLYQLPELDFNPVMCGLWLNQPLPCRSARAAVDAYAAGYRAVLDTVLARYPQIERVDPTALVCSAAWCSPRQGAELLYRDDNHLSVTGAREVITNYKLSMNN